MFLYELIPADEFPDPGECKFYLGDSNYHRIKWFEFNRPTITILIPILAFVYMTGSNITNPTVLWYCLVIYLVAMLLLHVLLVLFSLRFPVHRYPEFAVSDKRLWYRFGKRWHWLEWFDIHKVSVVKFRHHHTALLIYSWKLPWFHRGRNDILGYLSLSNERVILVSWIFPSFSELHKDIVERQQQASQELSSQEHSHVQSN